jgi:hypothetical protein
VHLGRFIEVVHSKSYADAIEIGFAMSKAGVTVKYQKDTEIVSVNDEIHATYTYKSTKRTQDISMEKAEYSVGARNLTFRNTSDGFTVRLNGKQIGGKATHQSGL